MSNPEPLKTELDKIEGYLNEIVKEYQDNRKKLMEETTKSKMEETTKYEYELKKLGKLKEFIGPYAESKEFKTQFKKPIKKIREILLEEINLK